ncbi:hypothetical protein VOLCADRAFT_101579 [Volvox carteri f. nagariensis]|uniref:Haloacid dehalogenase-like hydrolase n=1 Tax=Volvox carteri f. nagariensis TaxID=3068 RepID=D8THN0_VOLCA|nr:uncharacterized protein VOLCADRAFT_101579 [Volvox carteri f. nagariensis]EFJ53097.1 hypothetical protein VOLCADRAFT_101579 [Volvox carteri f. nagariensis]|eukprot:XP_002946102.1 hypothetical protein VOLCADRAFT_101579 [Volvox carteri f. nagariensis]
MSLSVRCAATGTKLIALDFDGVVCDSVGESSLSAFKAAALLWPEIFQTPEAEARKNELVEKMRAVRPVVETGYENIIQIRCLYEGVSVDEMLATWETMLPSRMAEWGLNRGEMVELFGQVRDDWIAADLDGWLAPNRIYEGVADPVCGAMSSHQVYIVTTKQAHYTEILMRDMASVPFPADRIFSQTVSGRPKGEVLAALAAQHPDVNAKIFVEDKLSTLEKVARDPALSDWQLFLVDWGYNTPGERARAAAHPAITVIDKHQFKELLTVPAAAAETEMGLQVAQ